MVTATLVIAIEGELGTRGQRSAESGKVHSSEVLVAKESRGSELGWQ